MTSRSGSGIPASAAADRGLRLDRREEVRRIADVLRRHPRPSRGRWRAVPGRSNRARRLPPRRQRDELRPAARRAQPVDRPVAGDRAQPGSQGTDGSVEAFGAVPERQEDLLDHVLGDRSVSREAVGRGEDRVHVAIVERGQGILGPCGDRGDEDSLVDRRGPAHRMVTLPEAIRIWPACRRPGSAVAAARKASRRRRPSRCGRRGGFPGRPERYARDRPCHSPGS